MNKYQDGPATDLFSPIIYELNEAINFLEESHISREMANAYNKIPQGDCVFRGLPYKVGTPLLLVNKPITINISPTQARWIVFLHTADRIPNRINDEGFISPMKGEGQLGDIKATYGIFYQDGSKEKIIIQSRRQIGAFQRRWGENCFEAVPAIKPHPVRAAHEQLKSGWGYTQTRVEVSDGGSWVNWLWAWKNPQPEKTITGFRFEPGNGPIVILGMTAGNTNEHPLRWYARQKAVVTLPVGMTFSPELDEIGRYQQIQIDLGQVISASLCNLYPDQDWERSYNNQLPLQSSNKVLVEYTSHPEARFYLAGDQIIPVSEIANQSMEKPITLVKKAEKLVNLRIVNKASREIIPVKLHIHGETAEYLAPMDRHRIINTAWFEDYSVDYSHEPWNYPTSHPCTYISGDTWLKLPIGKIYLEISKGFEIRPVRYVYEVTPTTDIIQIELEKVLAWRENGWVTADTHVHFLSPISAMLEGSAEGVNVINLLASQWGELMTNVGDFDGKNTWGSKEAGGTGEYLVRVGSENRQHIMGHISLLGYRGQLIAPMTTGGPDESALGDPIDNLLTEWARQCHQQEGLVILPHFPNPRAEHAASIVSGDIDGIEMTSWENLYGGIDPYSLSDWYRYLNCGYMVPVVGGTDKMSASTAVGTVRTYARIDPKIEFSYESWKKAIQSGHTFVTYGPLLEFNVDGHPMGSEIKLGMNGGTVNASWKIASVTVPMTRIDLIVNGEIIESQAIKEMEQSGSWSYHADRSCWLAILIRGHYADKPEIITAHSSPVMVRVEGSPMISAPDAVTILDQIEGSLAYLDTVGTRSEDVTYKRMRMVLESAYRKMHERMHRMGYYHDHVPVNDHT